MCELRQKAVAAGGCRMVCRQMVARSVAPSAARDLISELCASNVTSSRFSFRCSSSCLSAYCGWVSPTCRHWSSGMALSRPARITVPFSIRAITDSKLAVAGWLPVEPAAMTGVSGGVLRHAVAISASKRLRCVAGSTSPSASSSLGQCCETILRKSSVCCQCICNSSGASFSRLAKSTPSRSTSSMSLASWRARARGLHHVGAATGFFKISDQPGQQELAA